MASVACPRPNSCAITVAFPYVMAPIAVSGVGTRLWLAGQWRTTAPIAIMQVLSAGLCGASYIGQIVYSNRLKKSSSAGGVNRYG